MRKITPILLLTLIPALPAFSETSAGIHFEEGLSWPQVLDKAKAENKAIFVDCFATWCGPCKSMDKDVYPDAKVGAYFNEHFLSIKVQMDATKHDSEFVQSWRKDAQTLVQEYKITAYPTFLFFSPEGKGLHKGVGGRSRDTFLALAEDASDSAKQYYTRLDRYQTAKDYSVMPDLANDVATIDGKEAAQSLALDYLDHHLATLDSKDLTTKQTLEFLLRFQSSAGKDPVMTTSGRIFQALYAEAAKPGELSGVKKQARDFVDNAIIAEEIDSKLYEAEGKNHKVLVDDPDWPGKAATITRKYGAGYTARVLPRTETSWYRTVKKDYNQAAKYWLDYIDQEGVLPTKDLSSVTMYINGVLWDIVFERCTDPAVLRRATRWGQRVVEDNPGRPEVMDTLANLLYKAGRAQEGIAMEERAVTAAEECAAKASFEYKRKIEPDKSYRENIEKMKKGLPTWDANPGDLP